MFQLQSHCLNSLQSKLGMTSLTQHALLSEVHVAISTVNVLCIFSATLGAHGGRGTVESLYYLSFRWLKTSALVEHLPTDLFSRIEKLFTCLRYSLWLIRL